MIHMRQFNDFESCNVRFLVNKRIEFATIQITETGYGKGILDATAPVRAYFKEKGVHDYELQAQGDKVLKPTAILTETGIFNTSCSLYRPKTKKGDPRMWVYGSKDLILPDNIFCIIAHDGLLYIINLSLVDIEKGYSLLIHTPLKDLINSISSIQSSTSEELLDLIRDKMSDWLPTPILADTGVGRSVEYYLGIPMNPSKEPDFKGIELKSKRQTAKVRNTLFTQTPDWNLSRYKTAREICAKYGYDQHGDGVNRLHVTLSALKPNAQHLGLNVNQNVNLLEANEYLLEMRDGKYPKVSDVVVWQLLKLHERLMTKHHETFWIDVDTMVHNGVEHFRVMQIEHTKNPIASQFDTLLEQGLITVDFLLCRRTGGDTYSFKINGKARPLLFPQSETYTINY